MENILLLVNSALSTQNAKHARQVATTLREQGSGVTVFLIQDGVLAALNSESASQILPDDVQCYALSEDLRLRGWTEHDVRERVHVADYAQLVDLFEQHTRVIGAL